MYLKQERIGVIDDSCLSMIVSYIRLFINPTKRDSFLIFFVSDNFYYLTLLILHLKGISFYSISSPVSYNPFVFETVVLVVNILRKDEVTLKPELLKGTTRGEVGGLRRRRLPSK